MIDRYPVTPDFRFQRPLQESDQALIDAIEQLEPGVRGDEMTTFVGRMPGRRPTGTFGEVIIGAVLNDEGQQDFVYVDVMPVGVIAGIDTREPGTRGTGKKKCAFFPSTKPNAVTPEAQSIKLEAARRIRAANETV